MHSRIHIYEFSDRLRTVVLKSMSLLYKVRVLLCLLFSVDRSPTWVENQDVTSLSLETRALNVSHALDVFLYVLS